MKNIKRHIIIIIILVAALAGTFVFSKDENRFPHKVHIDNRTECAHCHKKINESTSTTGGPDVPGRAICGECHDEGLSKRMKFRYEQNYQMNHTFHMADLGLECKNCHEGLYTMEAPPQEESVVKMEYCFQCHDNATATQYCMLCHVNPIKPDDHNRGWENPPRKKGFNRAKGMPEVPYVEEFVPPLPHGLERNHTLSQPQLRGNAPVRVAHDPEELPHLPLGAPVPGLPQIKRRILQEPLIAEAPPAGMDQSLLVQIP